MSLISKDIFLRLLTLYKTEKLNELSLALGYKESWAAATRKREGIPFEACAKAAIEHNVSMDFLLFGSSNKNQNIDINDLKIAVTEGVFSAIQTEMITLSKDVKISQVTETITSEIKESLSIESNLQSKAE